MDTGQCLVNSALVLPTTEQEQADNTCSGPGKGPIPTGWACSPVESTCSTRGPGSRSTLWEDHKGQLSVPPQCLPMHKSTQQPVSERTASPSSPRRAPSSRLVTQHHHLNHSVSTSSCSGVCSQGTLQTATVSF